MQQYDKAEQLYFRSIEIGKKLFGDGYSGLEYDYRGLLKLYHSRGDVERTHEFQVRRRHLAFVFGFAPALKRFFEKIIMKFRCLEWT